MFGPKSFELFAKMIKFIALGKNAPKSTAYKPSEDNVQISFAVPWAIKPTMSNQNAPIPVIAALTTSIGIFAFIIIFCMTIATELANVLVNIHIAPTATFGASYSFGSPNINAPLYEHTTATLIVTNKIAKTFITFSGCSRFTSRNEKCSTRNNAEKKNVNTGVVNTNAEVTSGPAFAFANTTDPRIRANIAPKTMETATICIDVTPFSYFVFFVASSFACSAVAVTTTSVVISSVVISFLFLFFLLCLT
mmetsp:Transcript_5555/g.17576  ORF Transcript_5555/g.17576 Transcript_5555/m.17576 type:complete len:250 (+) Transcript_5555:280-1029(+)